MGSTGSYYILKIGSLIIVVVFNATLSMEECWGIHCRMHPLAERLHELFISNNLLDIFPNPLSPTWHNDRSGEFHIGKRLDLFIYLFLFLPWCMKIFSKAFLLNLTMYGWRTNTSMNWSKHPGIRWFQIPIHLLWKSSLISSSSLRVGSVYGRGRRKNHSTRIWILLWWRLNVLVELWTEGPLLYHLLKIWRSWRKEKGRCFIYRRSLGIWKFEHCG